MLLRVSHRSRRMLSLDTPTISTQIKPRYTQIVRSFDAIPPALLVRRLALYYPVRPAPRKDLDSGTGGWTGLPVLWYRVWSLGYQHQLPRYRGLGSGRRSEGASPPPPSPESMPGPCGEAVAVNFPDARLRYLLVRYLECGGADALGWVRSWGCYGGRTGNQSQTD
jgi:hypothetical protein